MSSHAVLQGPLLFGILLSAFSFGVVSQQFYEYWARGFKDSIRLKIFVAAQFLVVAFQGILMWIMAYYVFVTVCARPPSSHPPDLWEGPVNSLCQLILILSANVFLAARIQALTKSRFQSGIVVTLSAFAFVIGMVTNVITWKLKLRSSVKNMTSVTWHAIQALVESLITIFLSRGLLKSRSGLRRSDSIVNYLIRNVIRTGCLATIWAIAGLVTWFWLSRNVTMVYRIFDITSGTIYTHAIFDTLLSRAQLREDMNMAMQSHMEFGLPPQNSRGHQSVTLRFFTSASAAEVSNMVPTAFDSSQSTSGPSLTSRSDAVELKSLPTEKLDGQCEIPHRPHPEQ